jgi:hypothetical protein
MIDYHKEFLSALKSVMPNVYHESKLTNGTKTPCISYMELTNIDAATGDTLGYSRLAYQVKVWGHDLETIQRYVLEVDSVLRQLGFKRFSSQELTDSNTSLTQKILGYECLVIEYY